MGLHLLDQLGLAIGLDWTLHDSEKDAKRALPHRERPRHVRKVVARSECAQGVEGQGTRMPEGKRHASAAALVVAGLERDALVFEPIGDGLIWVCAVGAGIPISGYDVVQTEEDARETISHLMSYTSNANLIGSLEGASKTLEEVLAQARPKLLKAARLRRQGEGAGRAARVGGIALLVVGGWQIYAWMTAEPPLPAPVEIPVDLQEPEAEPEPVWVDVEKIKREKLFQERLALERIELLNAVAPRAQFALWYDVQRSIPLSAYGWAAREMNCEPSKCEVAWGRGVAAMASDAKRLPGEFVSSDGNSARTSFAVPLLAPRTHAPEKAQADLQTYFMDVSVSGARANAMIQSAPVKDELRVVPENGENEGESVLIGRQGTWQVSGTNPITTEAVLERLSVPGVALSSMKVQGSPSLANAATALLQGIYRVAAE